MSTDAEGLRAKVTKALTSQDQGTVTLLSSLLAVQDELGYLPDVAIEETSRFTSSTINDVWGVASFYTNFRFTPPGAHTVELCWGSSCHVLGAMGVIRGVLEGLGLEGEGDTEDGLVSVRFNTCLGACSQGPVISVDDHLMGRLSTAMARDAVLSLYPGRQDGPTEEPSLPMGEPVE